jgi:hypothetical protein
MKFIELYKKLIEEPWERDEDGYGFYLPDDLLKRFTEGRMKEFSPCKNCGGTEFIIRGIGRPDRRRVVTLCTNCHHIGDSVPLGWDLMDRLTCREACEMVARYWSVTDQLPGGVEDMTIREIGVNSLYNTQIDRLVIHFNAACDAFKYIPDVSERMIELLFAP